MTKKRRPHRTPAVPSQFFAQINRSNTRLTTKERTLIENTMRGSLAAMREARSTYKDWLNLCTALNVGQAIETQGVVRGFRSILNRAYDVLQLLGGEFDKAPAKDGSVWETRALRHHELDAIDDLVYAYLFQIGEVTFSEYQRAYALATRRVQTDGGAVVR